MPDATDAVLKETTDEAAQLAQGAVDSLPDGVLAEKLAAARAEGRQLRVKLGIDPTAPDIHLGHAVVLGKLRQFQDAGHRVVLIVGDFTARVGDPSGRSSLRPMLSQAEIASNAKTFQDQATLILDPDPERLEVRHNSEWLDMSMTDLLALVRTATVAQMLEREDFAKRWHANEPISMLELLYPLLQGYDSVAVAADVELGGTDQKFNLLLGRDVQRAHGRPEQAILTMPILVGTDGHRKMSKSFGNQIGVTDEPAEMYGKTMSIPDSALAEYFGLLLRRDRSGAHSPEDWVDQPDDLAPRDAKRLLAFELVRWLHSPEQAVSAQDQFDRVTVEKLVPENLVLARARVGPQGAIHLPETIAEAFDLSRSEARRLIDQGAVSLDGEPLRPGDYDLEPDLVDGRVLKAGKRRFARLQAG
jgi:tyrosyl-tRNA synthetase